MPDSAATTEARRQLSICNSCRYCEGYCAVFPALELRSTLNTHDVAYLANLCHECGACAQACMYSPPHEFAINIPQVMRTAREQSYVDYAWPRKLASGMWAHPYATVGFGTVSGLTVALIVTLVTGGGGALDTAHTGAGAFYDVVPWLAMMLPAMAASLVILTIVGSTVATFWNSGRTGPSSSLDWRAFTRAMLDALQLRYLRGGGADCPGESAERQIGRASCRERV